MKIRMTGEDFDRHWGFVNWKDKQILDIGADYGSTAECFMALGATKVYAIEGDENLYRQLEEYTKNIPTVIPEKRWISGPNDFIYLFKRYKVDVVKMDCEGAEQFLFDVPDDILKSVKEYAIECHCHDLIHKIPEKFKSLKFDIINIVQISDGTDAIKVVHVINRN